MSTEVEPRRDVKAAKILLRLVLNNTEGLFRHRMTLTERTWEKTLDSGKKILKKSQAEPETRQYLGASTDCWQDLNACFEQALPVLEQQSFASHDPTNAEHGGSSAALMIINSVNLTKDLERMTDLLTIARNMLATTVKAQNLAAEIGFDQTILKLIDIIVRVTARGYDGEAGNRSENQWSSIITSYKKLLITCLQFVHNLVMHNEYRKFILWLHLFGYRKDPDQPLAEEDEALQDTSSLPLAAESLSLAAESLSLADDLREGEAIQAPRFEDLKTTMKVLEERGRSAGTFSQENVDSLTKDIEETFNWIDRDIGQNHRPSPSLSWERMPGMIMTEDDRVQEDDAMVLCTSKMATDTLESAKRQLMARLQDRWKALNGEHVPITEENTVIQRLYPDGDGSAEDDEEDDDDEYNNPGDQKRGVFTDIPLVLGPHEVEALPMIVQAGIVNVKTPVNAYEAEGIRKMQQLRCHLLLAQESGRNLLRELLIFIAAWDLQDDDFYFRLMMQIMDAILSNGLVPFAYHSFGEIKDIVSPAQSIVIKLLTQIFRKRQGLPPVNPAPFQSPPPPRRKEPSRADVLAVRYIFTVFRQSIIPETCALIYLQGQIRVGKATNADFPLNLWDMERVYEGIYQFLEFFAVLTESEVWKEMLVKWEIVSELITLLRELDGSIPNAPLAPLARTVTNGDMPAANMVETNDPSRIASANPVAVERPYDPASADGAFPTYEHDVDPPESPSQGLDNQDPSEFEWRNLKKLVVLVLSSLVWKSIAVQNQIREHGGVEMILNCCNFDANNPYIREHAIMCVRFLMEGCPENQKIVEELEAHKVVPNEVLDKQGFETFIDSEGKVGLRKKDGPMTQPFK